MAITADTDETDREGIAVCALQVTRLGLAFREQGTSDFGVDAQAEMKREGRPTGRLVGLQIKSGPSYFDEPYEDGWIFRPKKKHVRYWLNHSLPVYVLLVKLDTMTVYWQEVTEQQLWSSSCAAPGTSRPGRPPGRGAPHGSRTTTTTAGTRPAA